MSSLTHVEAVERGALLSVTSYHVDLDLTTGPDTFISTTKIIFSASTPGSETFIDIKPSALRSIVLNGKPLAITALRDGRFPVPDLAADNELIVEAEMRYSRECEGLHRYVDPADGQVYVYAFVYVDNAPRVFACFDQPDLKAPYTFTVTAPEGWQVLGTGEATQTAPGRWELAQTPPQATYLTTIVAGPYASFHIEHGDISLGLHCRASLAESLKADVDEIFEITGQCLDECHRLFGVPYPFGKLDQVYAPEFSVLSLDHPGCVLLREQYLFSSAATASERETRAVVLAHGISLQWLAGLVTMKWWDDLWLGQAFADYSAHRVASTATRFPGPPTTFAARRKGQAYVADQRPSTHPVCLEGPDVQSVLLDLDRISYFKGHSTLRQLATRIGDEALRTGLRTYFARHAYSTATFTDFHTALSEAAGADLTGWADVWLRTANVNTLIPEIAVSEGRITAAAVRQSAPDSHPVLRPHSLNVGLYGKESPTSGGTTVGGDGAEERGVKKTDRTTVRVEIDGERTELPELVGRPAPDLLLLNDGDLTYAKIRFDDRSRAALPRLLPELSPINRAMVWCALLMGVQDGSFPAADHLDLVTHMVAVETELSILAEVLEQARNDVADRFLDPGKRNDAMARVADALSYRLAATAAGDERQITLFRGLIDFTADAALLRGWLADTGLPEGLALDTDLSWRIRHRLAALGELTEAEIDAAYQADPTGQSEQFATKCRAAMPDPAAKERAWAAIMGDTGLSSYGLWALAEGFWQPEQTELTAPYVERFFLEMPEAAKLRGDLVLDLLIRFLYPRYAAEPETLDMADRLIARTDIPLPLRRRVADFTDDLRLVVEVRRA